MILAQAARPADSARLRVSLQAPDGRPVPLTGAEAAFQPDGSLELKVSVSRPILWDAEHPNLYRLVGEIVSHGAVLERVSRVIGFRRVEVRGVRLLVNGTPVKLHGTCRHELDPARGRSLTPAMWARDVELLKAANINYVRTSHYPPAEEFLDLCDRAGIYVQDEGPFCWVSGASANAPETLGLLLRSTAEMIERDRSHPSVIIWDLANESSWGENFRKLHDYVRAEDPSRPTLFSGAGDAGVCEIASWHYPGPGFTASLADLKRPVTFDEYCHLNCYVPAEHHLDPGLRDYWGRAIEAMWDEMQAAPACLGGSIWCWADDVFDVPKVGRVGYGEWGIVDAFRRPKPEFRHVQGAYSPIRISRFIAVPTPRKPLSVPVENRFDATSLSEIRCEWRLGDKSGVLRPNIRPGEKGLLTIPTPIVRGTLSLRFFAGAEPRLVDEYAFPIDPSAPPAISPAVPPAARLRKTAEGIEISGPAFTVSVALNTGMFAAAVRKPGAPAVPVIAGGPWVAASKIGTADDAFADGAGVPAVGLHAEEDGYVVVRWTKDAPFGHVAYSARVSGDGAITVDYELRYSGGEVGVREVGLLWSLPPGLQRLSWRRQGQWTVYPEDHIGRLVGDALAFPVLAAGKRPASWSLDPDPRGCNDFRASKYNIVEASLTEIGGAGVRVVSDGKQSVRATVVGAPATGVALRVNDFFNGGGEGFLQGHYARETRTLKPGDILTGTTHLRLLPG